VTRNPVLELLIDREESKINHHFSSSMCATAPRPLCLVGLCVALRAADLEALLVVWGTSMRPND
jgi:hypothetical protein